MNKKELEERCLNIVSNNKKCSDLIGNVKSGERPDFIINDTIGVEHFLIDIISNIHGDSIIRTQNNKNDKKVNYYKNNPEKLDFDIENIKEYLENSINEQINGMSNFNYKEFITHFKEVYTEHYNNITEYRKKCNSIGFLIEMPYVSPWGGHGYVIENNGKKYNQVVKTIPFTHDMINCLKLKNNVDFVIFCIIPINFSSNKKDYKNLQIIRVDMNNIENSIRKQGIIICDKFDFSVKFTNNDVAKLKIEEKGE